MLARAFIILLLCSTPHGFTATNAVHYELLYGSTARRTVHGSSAGFWGARGSFELRLLEETPELTRYALEGLRIDADFAHRFVGAGVLHLKPNTAPQLSFNVSNVFSPDTP